MRKLALVLVAWMAVACASQPVIEQADVERIIGTLAADDMQGRRTFTPGAAQAAEFIRGEFENIGLDTLDGAPDYLQRFPVYSTAVDEVSATINGAPVPEDRMALGLSPGTIDWTRDSGVETVVIGPEDSLRTAFQAMRSGGDHLVLVNSAHASMFARLRSALAGGRRSLEPTAAGNTVMILTDLESPAAIHVTATGSSKTEEIANVVGVIRGRRADELVVFSGHYDHLGMLEPVDGDAIANGANDDASGTTAVIELARYFAAARRPERTLVFVAFVAEEMGGYGSRYFSTHVDPDQIVAMFNIEMIGKGSSHGPNTVWITGFERSDFGAILQRAVKGTDYEFYADPYPDQNLFYRSDNATLARLGVPAHTISTTPIDVDPDYHQVSDEIETLDLEHMTNTIRAIAAGARTIVDGTETPSRIDPATVR